MQQVNGVPVLSSDPSLLYFGLDEEPTWFSAQGGVYKCIERTTDKHVAVKKYLVEEDSQHQDMFVMPKELVENEIYSMTKCLHPNILKLLAVHLHQEFVYLIMPLCTGGSLQQYVFDHHLTVGQLVHIITSIASGLAKVHSYGYIHRDIKCDNIFLDQEDNSIVIGDFGVVSISPAADSSVEEAGVVLFWSPELVQQKIVNHKVDVWALGIVILEVLNGGKAPYEDEKLDEDEIKQRILDAGKPDYPPNLPSRLVDLLDCCLDPDPRIRSSASSILQHPFLKDYEPELLFPATRLEEEEEDISSQSDSDQLDNIMHDIIIEQETPNELNHKQLNTTTDVHYFDTETASVLPLPPTKCRLPLPSFSFDKSISAATPVKEKIANVIRKRQSLTDSNRSQGSRIPMLCILKPVTEEPVAAAIIVKQPRLRSVKSVRLPPQQLIQQKSSVDVTPIPPRKPLNRSNTAPAPAQKRQSQRSPSSDVKSNLRKPKITSPQPPPTQKAKKELPPKSSIYRHKRLPAGESRTARLMMGVSTTGRRQSFRQREETEKEVAPTLGNRFGKLFNKKETEKKRPISFAASSSSALLSKPPQQHNTETSSIKSIPNKLTTRSRRQSVPIPPSKLIEETKSTKKSNGIKNSIKALRVH
ncbi:kinase-like domain-containing protein [Helicostylum pulchrum]|nr:kinase-like domain-containing protein [Helicostylum pulchrum]